MKIAKPMMDPIPQAFADGFNSVPRFTIQPEDLPRMMGGLLGACKELESCFEQMQLAVSPITGAGRELRQQCHGVKRDLQNFRKHFARFEDKNSTQGVT